MAWQTLSHTVLQLHAVQETYTPNQDAILKVLSENLSADGQYFVPNVPPGTSMDDMAKYQEASMGKPWAQINYHKAMDMSMTANILRGLGTNIAIALVLVWMLGKMKHLSYAAVLMFCLAVGFISFAFHPFPGYIWYKTMGINTELLDSLAGFGLAGLWLGWFMPRKKA
jgi:hypothetical protein